ncbi:MAG: pilus assembly protein PilM [bacterium]|nr:pilus assembly protein PilM [Candidatus Margulisiibacteriota bacterium]
MRPKDFLKKKTKVVGLDITDDRITVAFKEKTASSPTPADSVKAGQIIAPQKIAQAIHKLLAKEKIKSKTVALAIHGPDLLLHVTSIPYIKEAGIRESLEKKVNQYVAYAGTETALAWQKVDETFQDGERKLKLLIAVAKRSLVNSYVKAVELAGLRIRTISLPSIASFNALAETSLKNQARELKLFAHVDKSQVFIHVVQGTAITFAHGASLDDLIPDIQKVISSYQGIASVVVYCADENLKHLFRDIGQEIGKPVQMETDKVAAGLIKMKSTSLNLLPLDVRLLEEWRSQLVYFLVTVFGTTFFMLGLFFAIYFWGFMIEEQIAEIKAQLSQPNLEFTQLKEIEDKTLEIKALIAGRRQMVEKRTDFKWDDILKKITELVPAKVGLIDIEHREKEILLEGEAVASDNVFVFLRQLKKANYFKEVELRQVRQRQASGDLTTFSIRLELK